jgi:hypothetical protein
MLDPPKVGTCRSLKKGAREDSGSKGRTKTERRRTMLLRNHCTHTRCPIIARIACVGLVAFTLHLSAATIVVQPPPAAVLGEDASVLIDLQNVVDLYGWQFDVQFNPAVLQLQSVTEGQFLQQAGSTQFFPGIIDNVAGLVSLVSNTLTGAVPGQTGSGTAVILTFGVGGIGTSEVSILNPILLNSSLDEIPATPTSATITVVPEPAFGLFTFLLVLLVVSRSSLKRLIRKRSR